MPSDPITKEETVDVYKRQVHHFPSLFICSSDIVSDNPDKDSIANIYPSEWDSRWICSIRSAIGW